MFSDGGKKSPFVSKDPLKTMRKASPQRFSATAESPMRTRHGTCGTELAAPLSAVGQLPAIATISPQLAYTISSFFLAKVS